MQQFIGGAAASAPDDADDGTCAATDDDDISGIGMSGGAKDGAIKSSKHLSQTFASPGKRIPQYQHSLLCDAASAGVDATAAAAAATLCAEQPEQSGLLANNLLPQTPQIFLFFMGSLS